MQIHIGKTLSTRQHGTLPIKSSTRLLAKQDLRKKAAIIKRTRHKVNTNLNSKLSVDATSDSDSQRTETSVTQSVQSARPVGATKTPAPTGDNRTRKPFDQDTVLPLFREDLRAIVRTGEALQLVANEYHGKVQEKAISALAQILGIRRCYFDPVDGAPEAGCVLLDDLYQQCKNRGLKGRTKRTTEFHLFSRLLRGSDRKQASADAKILIRAHDEGQTEQTFTGWVAKHGSLSAVLKGITDCEKTEQAKKREESKNDKGKCIKRAIDAIEDAVRAHAWTPLVQLCVPDLPDQLKALLPSSGKWMPFVVRQQGDQLKFFVLVNEAEQATDSNSNEDSSATTGPNSEQKPVKS